MDSPPLVGENFPQPAMVKDEVRRLGVAFPGDAAAADAPFHAVYLATGPVVAGRCEGYLVYSLPWCARAGTSFCETYLTVLGAHPGQRPPSSARHASAALSAAPTEPAASTSSDAVVADTGAGFGGGGGSAGGDPAVASAVAQLQCRLKRGAARLQPVQEVALPDGTTLHLHTREVYNFGELLVRYRVGALAVLVKGFGTAGAGADAAGGWIVHAAVPAWAGLRGLVAPAVLAAVLGDGSVASELRGALAAAGYKNPDSKRSFGKPSREGAGAAGALASAGATLADVLAVYGTSDVLAPVVADLPPSAWAPGGGAGLASDGLPAVVSAAHAVCAVVEASTVTGKAAKAAWQARREEATAAVNTVLQALVAVGSGGGGDDSGGGEGGEDAAGRAVLPFAIPLFHFNPELSDVLYVTRSGSYMYDLHTATSDEDYVILVAHRVAAMSAVRPPVDRVSVDACKAFGADKAGDVEYRCVRSGGECACSGGAVLCCRGGLSQQVPVVVRVPGPSHPPPSVSRTLKHSLGTS